MKNKFHTGKYAEANNFKGWFIGSFFEEGHPCKTDHIEMMYKEHKKGDLVKPHYHEQKVEVLIMIEGKAKYIVNDNEVILESGSYLFADVNNVISAEFLEDSKIFAIHSPSLSTDKVVI